MALPILKGLVANYGKLGYQVWHRPLKMASLVYEREIGGGVSVTFDGILFIMLGEKVRWCYQGPD